MGNFIEMPKFDMSMTEGTITKWLVSEGDNIEEGQDIFEVETGKASNIGDSLYSGKLLKIYCAEGEAVPVFAKIAYVGKEGEEIPEIIADKAEVKEEVPATKKDIEKETAAAIEKSKPAAENYDYECVVIGAGPGGYVAAIKAAQLGMKAAIIEKGEFGGTCLNRGCIPTKAFYASAKVYEDIKAAESFGLSVEGVSFDWTKILNRKEGIVKKLSGGVEMLLKKNGVAIIKGEGKITDGHTVSVGDKNITSKYMIIATGSKPVSLLQNVDDDVKLLNTDDFLSMDVLPESMVIVGGGVIGVEIANILSAFDVKVTIIELMPRILPRADEEISDLLKEKLTAKGVEIINGAKILSIKKKDGKVSVALEDGKVIESDAILEAVGRTVDDRAFADLDIKRDKKGFIIVNKENLSSIDSIYAIGDATGGYMLAHEASKQGEVAVNSMLGIKDEKEIIIPACIFTKPEIAYVGMTEKEAKEAGYEVKVSKFPFAANGKALTIGETDGFVKVIADAKYGEILGVHIIGPEASNLIHEAVMAMSAEETVKSAAEMVHAHPTLAETLMEAFLGAASKAVHI